MKHLLLTACAMVIASSAAGETKPNDSMAKIVPLQKSVQCGQAVKVMLVLPKNDAERDRWKLVGGSNGRPLGGGRLVGDARVEETDILVSERGEQSIALLICNKSGVPIEVHQAVIDGRTDLRDFWSTHSSGVVVGVLLTLITQSVQRAFVRSDQQRALMEDGRRRLLQEACRFDIAIEGVDRFEGYEDWRKEALRSNACTALLRGRLKRHMRKLDSLVGRWNLALPHERTVMKEHVRAELRRIAPLLK